MDGSKGSKYREAMLNERVLFKCVEWSSNNKFYTHYYFAWVYFWLEAKIVVTVSLPFFLGISEQVF